MTRYFKKIAYSLPALFLLVACQDEMGHGGGIRPGNGEIRLSGTNAQQVTSRAEGNIKGFFNEGTLYRILTTKGGDVETATSGINDVGRDIVADGEQHYISLLKDKLVFTNADDVINIYGLTDPSIQKPETDADYQSFVDGYLPVKDVCIYDVEAKKDVDKYTLPDLRAAVKEGNTINNSGYIIPLHFKHILSKVEFEIVQQKDDADQGGMFKGITLEGIDVLAQPVKGTFNLKEDCFTSVGEKNTAYPVSMEKSIAIGTTPAKAGNILLFPMIDETLTEDNKLKVEVTLGGDKEVLKKFGEVNENGKVTLELPVYANNPGEGGTEGETGGSTTALAPLRLRPNHRYVLQFVMTSNDVRIITIVPRVYEWLDGEKDIKNDEDGFYEEQDLGQPVTFNGVVWSDRNLGASSAHPLRSVDDWMKSVGYYYQYDRNIPYFPNTLKDEKVDLNTPLVEALKQLNFIYPVVNYDAWGMDEYPNVDNQLKPKDIDDKATGLVTEIGKLPNGDITPLFNFDGKGANLQTGLWKKPETQPCPKGWRIPTEDDIYGIIPKSLVSGNITFRIIESINSGSGGFNAVNNTKEYDFTTEFSKDGISKMPDLSKNIDYMTDENGNKVLYLGEFPCLYREEKDDPHMGATSCYVLSMHGNDWNMAMDAQKALHNNNESYVYNYGVIYGLKNKGTDKAYRVKWELNLVGDFDEVKDFASEAKKHCTNDNTTQYDGKTAKKYKDGLKGVLAISRYTSSKDDNFDAKDGGYTWVPERNDWSNPVDVMYLPICGVAGNWSPSNGASGRMYNIGTEGWYATVKEYGGSKGILWIKVMGDNSNNQSIFYAKGSPKHDAVTIRPVRDN